MEMFNGGWYIFSNQSRGYINSIDGLIRGHGYFPKNTEAATREATTEFEMIPLTLEEIAENVQLYQSSSPRIASPVVQGAMKEAARVQGPGAMCADYCRSKYDLQRGYPTEAFSGNLADFLCPSMFRDLSDYVFKWPFSHFGEKLSVAPPDVAAKCLPPVPIVYVHGSSQDQLATWAKAVLKRPYILVSVSLGARDTLAVSPHSAPSP